jgi:hypothetical protein
MKEVAALNIIQNEQMYSLCSMHHDSTNKVKALFVEECQILKNTYVKDDRVLQKTLSEELSILREACVEELATLKQAQFNEKTILVKALYTQMRNLRNIHFDVLYLLRSNTIQREYLEATIEQLFPEKEAVEEALHKAVIERAAKKKALEEAITEKEVLEKFIKKKSIEDSFEQEQSLEQIAILKLINNTKPEKAALEKLLYEAMIEEEALQEALKKAMIEEEALQEALIEKETLGKLVDKKPMEADSFEQEALIEPLEPGAKSELLEQVTFVQDTFLVNLDPEFIEALNFEEVIIPPQPQSHTSKTFEFLYKNQNKFVFKSILDIEFPYLILFIDIFKLILPYI